MQRSSAIIGAALASCAVLLDQLVKLKVREVLEVGRSIHVAGPIYLTHVENTGSVFGIGQGYVIIPTIATIVILLAVPVILWYLKSRHGYMLSPFESACAGLIVGGAIGNLIDRVSRSAVTDFVDVVIFPGIHWPAFNVADACVVVGTLFLVVVFSIHSVRQPAQDVDSETHGTQA